jgi:hypothetical protein
MRSCPAPITSTRTAVTYVLLARNKTRPHGFFLPGRSFVTVRQADGARRKIQQLAFQWSGSSFFCGKQSPPFRDKHQTKRGVR